MILEIEESDTACCLKKFKINGKWAIIDDFVDHYDHAPKANKDNGCGNMKADVIPPTDDVLKYYNISKTEHLRIAQIIADKTSWGNCSACVYWRL